MGEALFDLDACYSGLGCRRRAWGPKVTCDLTLAVAGFLAPRYVTTAEQVGRAMVCVVEEGSLNAVLESGDVRRFGV